ncbi:MAG TPA: hypothetical protein VGH95_00810 [Candidatus Aquirickettsiella sp.]|jgi:hypothetical protein
MKIKYIGKFDSVIEIQHASTERLSIGNQYLVIELLSSVKKGVSYRLIGDNKDASPAIFPVLEFEIITVHVPTNWSLSIKKSGLIVNGPPSWRNQVSGKVAMIMIQKL